jgi:hypothetical protein
MNSARFLRPGGCNSPFVSENLSGRQTNLSLASDRRAITIITVCFRLSGWNYQKSGIKVEILLFMPLYFFMWLTRLDNESSVNVCDAVFSPVDLIYYCVE